MSLERTTHPMTAAEYSKIISVQERIAGLRRSMVVTAIVGLVTSLFVFRMVTSAGLFASNSDAFSAGLVYAGMAFVPFVATIGYLSNRVSRHVERLSRGRYEQLVPVDQA